MAETTLTQTLREGAERNEEVLISAFARIKELEQKVAELEEFREEFFKLERTVYGIQQMLGKAAEYQGKPRGRLPR